MQSAHRIGECTLTGQEAPPHPAQDRGGVLKSEGAGEGCPQGYVSHTSPSGSEGVGALKSATSRKKGTRSSQSEAGGPPQPERRAGVRLWGPIGHTDRGREGAGRGTRQGRRAAADGHSRHSPVRAGSRTLRRGGLAAKRAGSERAPTSARRARPCLGATHSRQPLLCGCAPGARGPPGSCSFCCLASGSGAGGRDLRVAYPQAANPALIGTSAEQKGERTGDQDYSGGMLSFL